jgi:hypothetical protein
MTFGTWNIRSLYKAGSLVTVAEDKTKYELGHMGREWHQNSRRLYIFLWKCE